MNKMLILTSLTILIGFNTQVNADRAEQGAFGGLFGGALVGGLAGGGKGAAIGGLAGAGLGYAMGKDADRRAERRQYSRQYQAPPAYVDYGDEDVVYVPVRRQRYLPQSYPRTQRRVAAPHTQRIMYRD